MISSLYVTYLIYINAFLNSVIEKKPLTLEGAFDPPFLPDFYTKTISCTKALGNEVRQEPNELLRIAGIEAENLPGSVGKGSVFFWNSWQREPNM